MGPTLPTDRLRRTVSLHPAYRLTGWGVPPSVLPVPGLRPARAASTTLIRCAGARCSHTSRRVGRKWPQLAVS